MLRDQTLAAQLSGRDLEQAHTALGAIVHEYSDRLIRFAYTIVLSSDAAEDVVQEVFVRMWDNRTAIDPRKSLISYLFTSVRNRSLDFVKHVNVTEKFAELAVDDATGQLDVTDRLDAEAIEGAVRNAIGRLPERRRTVLKLRYQEGLPFAEVGQVMGISEKAAKDLAARAIKEIREKLAL